MTASVLSFLSGALVATSAMAWSLDLEFHAALGFGGATVFLWIGQLIARDDARRRAS